jgi:hypothetical protein
MEESGTNGEHFDLYPVRVRMESSAFLNFVLFFSVPLEYWDSTPYEATTTSTFILTV